MRPRFFDPEKNANVGTLVNYASRGATTRALHASAEPTATNCSQGGGIVRAHRGILIGPNRPELTVSPTAEVEVTPMRIAIVNDLGLARFALQRVLVSSPLHEVAWMASDGVEAIVQAREDPPDLILMDLFMPRVDGVEATRQIMSESPCAILLVTSTVSGHLDKVYEAMGHGHSTRSTRPHWHPGASLAAPISC